MDVLGATLDKIAMFMLYAIRLAASEDGSMASFYLFVYNNMKT